MEKTQNNAVARTKEKPTWANPSLEGDPNHKLQMLLTHREKNRGGGSNCGGKSTSQGNSYFRGKT